MSFFYGTKPNAIKIADNFWLKEFSCWCGKDIFEELLHTDGYCKGAVMLDPDLMRALNTIRETMGPTTIHSGYRCWNYHVHLYDRRNKQLRQNKKPPVNSSHLRGQAADIETKKDIPYPRAKDWLIGLGITGVGYRNGVVTHIDVGHETFTDWEYK